MKIYGNEQNLKLIDYAIENNKSVLMIGETGTGKTTMIRELAKTHKRQVVRFNLTGETTVDDFVGKYTLNQKGATEWQDGILLKAMKEGSWLMVDEINSALPEILFVLHSLLDDDKYVVVPQHDNEIIRAHEDFRFFANMNPTDEYAGTKELNKAFKSRFDVTLYTEYASNKDEADIILERVPECNEGDAVRMIGVANEIREAKENHKIFFTISTRDLIQWAEMSVKFDFETGFKYAILNKANGDGDQVKAIYQNVIDEFEETAGPERIYSPENWLKTVESFKEVEESARKMLEEREKQLDEREQELYGKFGAQVFDALKGLDVQSETKKSEPKKKVSKKK